MSLSKFSSSFASSSSIFSCNVSSSMVEFFSPFISSFVGEASFSSDAAVSFSDFSSSFSSSFAPTFSSDSSDSFSLAGSFSVFSSSLTSSFAEETVDSCSASTPLRAFLPFLASTLSVLSSFVSSRTEADFGSSGATACVSDLSSSFSLSLVDTSGSAGAGTSWPFSSSSSCTGEA